MKRLVESVHTSVRMKCVRPAHCIHVKSDIVGFTTFFEKSDKTNEKFTLKPKCLWRVSQAQFVKYAEKCFGQMILMKMTKTLFLIFMTSLLILTMLVITNKKCCAMGMLSKWNRRGSRIPTTSADYRSLLFHTDEQKAIPSSWNLNWTTN
jgi:hypothetical protein